MSLGPILPPLATAGEVRVPVGPGGETECLDVKIHDVELPWPAPRPRGVSAASRATHSTWCVIGETPTLLSVGAIVCHQQRSSEQTSADAIRQRPSSRRYLSATARDSKRVETGTGWRPRVLGAAVLGGGACFAYWVPAYTVVAFLVISLVGLAIYLGRETTGYSVSPPS